MLNRIIVMGRLTRDPELRYTQGAEPIARVHFSLAVNRNYAKKDGEKETDFFDIEAWRQKAEFVSKYFKKGQLVCVEGRLRRDDWTDKEGNKRTTYKIVADNCYFAESKKQANDGQDAGQNSQQNGAMPDDFDPFDDFGGMPELDDDDDLPF